jgi:signal transduction histidine kinase
MPQDRLDITQHVFSTMDFRGKIGSIFPDSVILDNQFRFISISQNILEALGYSLSEIQNQCISLFSHASDLRKIIEDKLKTGYFNEEQLEIRSKFGDNIMYGVSGFYLGLIADMNGMIVLKFKNLDEINLMYDRLEAKTTELDRFVYLSGHSLRGPLATIKGLLNLTRMSTCQEEKNYLLSQIDLFAEKLDDKLYRLIYFAESDKEHESNIIDVDLEYICNALQLTIGEGKFDHPVRFRNLTEDKDMRFENGSVVLSLLRNVILFFCQQPKNENNELTLAAHCDKNATELIVRAKGFLFSDSIKEKLKSTAFGYSEILNYPELINCYAAKKIIFKLRGNIQFVQTHNYEVVVLMTFPKEAQ